MQLHYSTEVLENGISVHRYDLIICQQQQQQCQTIGTKKTFHRLKWTQQRRELINKSHLKINQKTRSLSSLTAPNCTDDNNNYSGKFQKIHRKKSQPDIGYNG